MILSLSVCVVCPVFCPVIALEDDKVLIGAGQAALQGRPRSLPCVGWFLRPRRPRKPGGGPRDRCHLGEVLAGPRVAPATRHLSSAELGSRRGVGGRRGAGPLLRRPPGPLPPPGLALMLSDRALGSPVELRPDSSVGMLRPSLVPCWACVSCYMLLFWFRCVRIYRMPALQYLLC